jgi:hypothetical protein
VAGGEAAPVLLRRNAEALHEGATKAVGMVKPDRIRHAFDGAICGREPGPCFVEAEPLDKSSGAALERRFETARELPRTKIHPLGQGID